MHGGDTKAGAKPYDASMISCIRDLRAVRYSACMLPTIQLQPLRVRNHCDVNMETRQCQRWRLVETRISPPSRE
jgi:hypothetical protein